MTLKIKVEKPKKKRPDILIEGESMNPIQRKKLKKGQNEMSRNDS